METLIVLAYVTVIFGAAALAVYKVFPWLRKTFRKNPSLDQKKPPSEWKVTYGDVAKLCYHCEEREWDVERQSLFSSLVNYSPVRLCVQCAIARAAKADWVDTIKRREERLTVIERRGKLGKKPYDAYGEAQKKIVRY